MKALIIAAGRGNRLSCLSKDKPKPLIQLLGLSLIERSILTVKQAGINQFIIIVGYLGDQIKAKLGDGSRYGVEITYIENKEWQRGNGISVLNAKKSLKEKFILMMADHIFETKILDELKETKFGDDECVLVVDKAPKEHVDLEDATKVKVENDKIINIGKGLKEYNAIDCGIFLCSPSIFDVLDESIRGGDETLSGGLRVLAKNGELRAFDIKDGFWADIDTEDDYRNAEKRLCEGLIKPTDGPVSKFLNRPISIKISRLLLKTKIKPNSISFLSFIICLLSAFLFSLGNYSYIVAGGVLAQFASVIDGCDGEVARLRFQQSNYGAWFDAVLDRYADALIILGMTYGWWSLHGDIMIWIVGFIALIGSFMNSYTAIKYDSIFIKRKGVKMRLGRDVRLFLIMVGSLTNQIFYTLIILGILTNIESVRRVYVLRNNTTTITPEAI